jgi:alpha-galactosidase
VNDGTPQELDLNGSTFDEPVSTVLRVNLHAGANTLSFGNPTNYAPDLDRIVIAPAVDD